MGRLKFPVNRRKKFWKKKKKRSMEFKLHPIITFYLLVVASIIVMLLIYGIITGIITLSNLSRFIPVK